MNRLFTIQQELKAPKNQKNNFGGYNYRSCEDILEAVKPLLKKQGLGLFIRDEIINIGNRYYVKANAAVYDDTGKCLADVSAYAREEETKKGMDASQITGSTSSYARKYALNGLFAIDDTKDADATNTHEKKPDVKPDIEPIDPDRDLVEGLKACSALSELEAYYRKYYSKVTDKATFIETKDQMKAKLKRKEVNNATGTP